MMPICWEMKLDWGGYYEQEHTRKNQWVGCTRMSKRRDNQRETHLAVQNLRSAKEVREKEERMSKEKRVQELL
jgi:hypothetical protein